MFSSHLFKHKYDIDDVLRALCGDDFNGRWFLNTKPKQDNGEQGAGELIPEAADAPEKIQASEFMIEVEPLPFKAIQEELTTHKELTRLDDNQKEQVLRTIKEASSMFDIHQAFSTGFEGGWLRERIKEEAMDWLDERDMVPPSMRHVRALDDQPDDLTLHIKK